MKGIFEGCYAATMVEIKGLVSILYDEVVVAALKFVKLLHG